MGLAQPNHHSSCCFVGSGFLQNHPCFTVGSSQLAPAGSMNLHFTLAPSKAWHSVRRGWIGFFSPSSTNVLAPALTAWTPGRFLLQLEPRNPWVNTCAEKEANNKQLVFVHVDVFGEILPLMQPAELFFAQAIITSSINWLGLALLREMKT